jgi:hypothetical protein
VQFIGKYRDRQIFWLDYENYSDQLPDKDWICLAISNKQPNIETFDKFVRTSISKNLLEFKGHGKYGEELHDNFDQVVSIMLSMENQTDIDVMTTWHNDETLADTFWQCFFATCLPDTADFDNIKIVCTDLDGVNKIEELKNYIIEFELGWLPSENTKHEVWKDKDELTTLCLADESGNDSRKLLEPESKLIHSFYAESHYEAMTIYYKYMNWGIYTTEFEIDKEPYAKKNGT